MGGRPLTQDRAAQIALDTETGNLAIGVVKRRVTEEQAVARLALLAPGRPDLVDAVVDVIERPGLPHPVDVDWPPRATRLALLRRVRRVTLGDVALVGPDGVRVRQVVAGVRGGEPRPLLRLERAVCSSVSTGRSRNSLGTSTCPCWWRRPTHRQRTASQGARQLPPRPRALSAVQASPPAPASARWPRTRPASRP